MFARVIFAAVLVAATSASAVFFSSTNFDLPFFSSASTGARPHDGPPEVRHASRNDSADRAREPSDIAKRTNQVTAQTRQDWPVVVDRPASVPSHLNSTIKTDNKTPSYGSADRKALAQLIEEYNDWDEEIEFVVPKPRRAIRPRKPKPDQKAIPAVPIDPAEPAEPVIKAPKPKLAIRPKRTRRVRRAATSLVSFRNSPFPYTGTVPHSGKSFLNYDKNGRRAHKTRRGRVYWADKTYSERRSLLHIPKGFNADAPGVMVVFFHGHGATLQRDIWQRQRLPQQITLSGMNAVLVAPQFGADARDSSIGNFWKPGVLRDYLYEASEHLAQMLGRPGSAGSFDRMPIVIVGYSGGYVPTAFAVAQGGINDRLRGIVLLDALYGQLGTFRKWIKQFRSKFFVSSYARSTTRGNKQLMADMSEASIAYSARLPARLHPGSVTFISAPVAHRHFVTQAWASNPVADILRRLPNLATRNGRPRNQLSGLSNGRENRPPH